MEKIEQELKDKLIHLARDPLELEASRVLTNKTQGYIWGFNIGGRPHGFWVARGTEWLQAVAGLDSAQFVPCCYLYEIELSPSARIYSCSDKESILRLIRGPWCYWLNFDYFDIDFYDYFTGRIITHKATHKLNYSFLRGVRSLRNALIERKLLFTNSDDAVANCEFYRSWDPARFTYIDWGALNKDWDGIDFGHVDLQDTTLTFYIWYQGLITRSVCIWRPDAIKNIKLRYSKKNMTDWELPRFAY